MGEFLLETYVPAWESLTAAEQRVRRAAAELAGSGVAARYVRSTFIPDDQLGWHVVECPSGEAAAEVARRAGIAVLRIVETAAAGAAEERRTNREVQRDGR